MPDRCGYSTNTAWFGLARQPRSSLFILSYPSPHVRMHSQSRHWRPDNSQPGTHHRHATLIFREVRADRLQSNESFAFQAVCCSHLQSANDRRNFTSPNTQYAFSDEVFCLPAFSGMKQMSGNPESGCPTHRSSRRRFETGHAGSMTIPDHP